MTIDDKTRNKKLQYDINRIIQKQLQMSMIKKYVEERCISPEERQKIIDEMRLV